MKQEGFTLVEILIYSALLAIFLGATFAFISSIFGTTDTLLEKNELIANQEFVERKLAWLAEDATGVISPAKNSSSSVLQINVASSTLTPAIFSFSSTTGEIYLQTGGSATTTIVSNRVKATRFQVEYFSNDQSTSTLKVSLSLTSAIFPNLVSTTTFFYVLPQ